MTSYADRLSALDTATVSDARDRLGLPSGVAHGLRCLAGGPATAGRAVTVDLVPVDDTSLPLTGPQRHLCTAAVDASGAGDVIVVAHSGRTAMAGWGGVLSTAASERGIAGVIVDGAVRDVDEAIALDFPIHAVTAVPVTARGRVQEREWNVPVTIAGVPVAPGDWVIADSSGVVFVEANSIDQVLTLAEEIGANERTMLEQLRSGTPVSEVMGARYETLLEDK